jgi:acyl-CoA reductase-like NAD-dependent aldehyde dehydrogenase
MAERLNVTKTYKLYINGAFPRSESGRSMMVRSPEWDVLGHVCHASRKDLRDAVGAARKAAGGWAKRTAYNRGQILYRMAEMLEGKSEEFVAAIRATSGMSLRDARAEVGASADRLVAFAGWADKFTQVMGCHNPVAGPYYTFTVPEATGVVSVVAPEEPSLLGLVSLLAPPLCAGCTVIAVGSERHPIASALLGEVCQTSDVPAGVVNVLTGARGELLEWIASHREIDAVHAADLSEEEGRTLRLGAAENVKRVTVREVGVDGWSADDVCESPWWIEPFVEMKTIWHPSAT